MVESSTVSYYLSVTGGSFTVLAGAAPYISTLVFPTYFAGGWDLFLILLISGSGIVNLIFGHRLSKPGQSQSSSLIVIVMSLVAWWGVIASRALLFSDFPSVGPFLSFAGGIIGLSGSIGKEAA